MPTEPKRSRAWRWLIRAANLAAALFAFAMVWVPEVRVYWARTHHIPAEQIRLARSQPANDVLREIGSQHLGIPALDRPDDNGAASRWTEVGETVIRGTSALGGNLAEPMPFPFRADNLEIGLPAQQLLVGSMVSTQLLLEAYRASGQRRFLDAALQEALVFSRIDSRQLIPRGFLWNDHAMTTRIGVLADLWSVVRSDSGLTDDQARALLGLADRSAARLARPGLYTFRTNHGIMQNLALLQFALAFPALERAAESRSVGCARLVEQFVYYMDSDGITLEHSAGYHELGRQLLSLAVRLLHQNNCPVPLDWHAKLERATIFSQLLTRPDRTLPAIGNTDHAPLPRHEAVDVATAPTRDWAVHRSAGFAVAWHGLASWPDSARMAQTVVTWSGFPSRAHKLADNMSVVIWAAGRPWLTNTGYWPYGVEGHEQATLWRGSNAPHFPGEGRPDHSSTTLRRAGHGPDAWMLELERVAANGAVLRRQVVGLAGATWIVIDSTDGPGLAVETLWTTMPETRVDRQGDVEFLLHGNDVGVTARLRFLGELDGPPVLHVGQLSPFGGWVMQSMQRLPAPAFAVRQRVPGLAATVLTVGTMASESRPARLMPEPAPENWRIEIGDHAGARHVERAGDRLFVTAAGGRSSEVGLQSVERDALAARHAALAAYESAVSRYPAHRDLTHYRIKLTYLLIGLLALQELTILLARRWRPALGPSLRIMATGAWIVVGTWAHFVYLR